MFNGTLPYTLSHTQIVLNVTETVHTMKRALQAWQHMQDNPILPNDPKIFISQHNNTMPQHTPATQPSSSGVFGGCRTWCGDVCVDTETHPEHCGSCGYACDAGVSCRMGFCCNLMPAVFMREACLAGVL